MSFCQTKQVKVEQVLPVHYASELAKYLINKKYFLKRIDVKKVEESIIKFDNIQDIWHAITR